MIRGPLGKPNAIDAIDARLTYAIDAVDARLTYAIDARLTYAACEVITSVGCW
jgi:hypothetical protein